MNRRFKIVLFVPVILMLSCSVMENIGSMDGVSDTNTNNIGIDTTNIVLDTNPSNVDSDSDGIDDDTNVTDTTPVFFRVDWVSVGGEISAGSNVLEVPGQWYSFADEEHGSTRGYIDQGNGTVCSDGIVQPRNDGEGYGGIGFHLCNSGPDEDPPYTNYTLAQCPFAADLPLRVIGISFEISEPLPDIFTLQLLEENRAGATYFEIDAASRTDYFFVDSLPNLNNADPVSIDDLIRIQFELRNPTDAPMASDFCVKNVQLLVMP